MKITNIYHYIKIYLGYKKLFSCILFSIFLGPQQAFSNVENQYLICFEPSDPEGIEFIPLMYYLENGRVKSYILDKQTGEWTTMYMKDGLMQVKLWCRRLADDEAPF